MSKDFSNAPFTVNGITVRPSWAWSKEYRAEILASMRQAGSGALPPDEIERRYVKWYAAQNELTYEQAQKKIMQGAA